MTYATVERAGEGGPLRALRNAGIALADTYRAGGRALIVAPLLVAVAVLPEFAQHVAEIHLGMFDSASAFRALANDPTRWAFGYAKVAGFVLSILLLARCVALGSVRAALLVRPRTLARVALGFALSFAAAWPFEQLQAMTASVALDVALGIPSALIQIALTLFIVGALLDDPTLTLRAAFTKRWVRAPLMALLLVATFVPAQALHMLNHRAALGQPDAVVWALMIWDSLWVGLFAALVGSAMAMGYRGGRKDPSPGP